MRGESRRVYDPNGSWPCSSIFHARSPNSIKLNPTLSQTVQGVKDDDLAAQLKKLLFRGCRNSSTKFFELRKVCHNPPYGKTLGGYSCCEYSYAKCKHYDDVLYISNESRHYYQATCPQCVLSIKKSCHQF